MKHLKSFAAVAVLVSVTACDQSGKVADKAATGESAGDGSSLVTLEQKISYLAATDFAKTFRSQGVELDAEAVAMAVNDVVNGQEMRLSKEVIAQAVESFKEKAAARQQEQAKQQEANEALAQAEREKLAEENNKAGDAFLLENGKKEGVVTLESGLQYKVIEKGTGPIPTSTDTVKVHYRGTLLDGTEFDSSYKRDVPATFQVTQVIAGWTEALQLMPEGSKWELYIPGDLAYGPGGIGKIGPNATLIFEVALLDASVSAEDSGQ